LALGLSALALAEPLATPDAPPVTALAVATIPDVRGGKAGPFDYERFLDFLPDLPISASGTSLSFTAQAQKRHKHKHIWELSQ
jgi:hypothetical protein